MRHESIPATLTAENLAKWILDNNDRTFQHVEKTDLDEETIHELEKKSSLASRAIDRLEAVKDQFMEVLKGGTPDPDVPFDISIPPTKGLKVLEANRKFADTQLEQGYSENTIDIYMIPNPEASRMVAVDIEGTEEEHKKYGKLFTKEKKQKGKTEKEVQEPEI